MSFSIDASLLVCAADLASPAHAKASAFLHGRAAGSESFSLTWPVLMTFLRITTHPAVFSRPLSVARALGDIEALLALPDVRAIGEEKGFWRFLAEDAAAVNARGPLVSDDHVAALLRQHGVKVLYTCDTDFRRFAFLEVRNPLG